MNLQSFLGVLGVGGQWRCHGHQPSLIPWRRRRVRLAVLQLRLSGLVERGKKLEAPQAVGWWSSRGERDSQTVDNNDTAWLFIIRWSRLSLQELQRLRFRGVSLLFGVMSLDFRKIWHVERFLGVRHIIIKGSCLTALERCTCCCPGCEAQSLGGCFFPGRFTTFTEGVSEVARHWWSGLLGRWKSGPKRHWWVRASEILGWMIGEKIKQLTKFYVFFFKKNPTKTGPRWNISSYNQCIAFGSLWRLTLVDLDEICISNTNRQLSVLRDWIIPALFLAMISHRCQAHPFRYGWSCQGHLLVAIVTCATMLLPWSREVDVMAERVRSTSRWPEHLRV